MIENYIEDNKFERTQLVLDIKNGKINKETISEILDELENYVRKGEIENPYIETKKLDVRKKSEWNENYLDYLISHVSSAEIFNRESIEYISKVAEYVNEATKRILKRILAILLGLCVLFLVGYITGRKHGESSESLKNEIASLKGELIEVQETNKTLSEEIQKLKEVNEDLSKQASEYKNKLDVIQSVFNPKIEEKQINTSVEKKTNDELSKFIERALEGENVKAEFNAQDKYDSKDVEKRAIEMGLKRNQAQLLIDNLANPKKFDINQFSE